MLSGIDPADCPQCADGGGRGRAVPAPARRRLGPALRLLQLLRARPRRPSSTRCSATTPRRAPAHDRPPDPQQHGVRPRRAPAAAAHRRDRRDVGGRRLRLGRLPGQRRAERRAVRPRPLPRRRAAACSAPATSAAGRPTASSSTSAGPTTRSRCAVSGWNSTRSPRCWSRCAGCARAVTLKRDARSLVSFVCPADVDPDAARRAVADVLPYYCVPAAVLPVAALPRDRPGQDRQGGAAAAGAEPCRCRRPRGADDARASCDGGATYAAPPPLCGSRRTPAPHVSAAAPPQAPPPDALQPPGGRWWCWPTSVFLRGDVGRSTPKPSATRRSPTSRSRSWSASSTSSTCCSGWRLGRRRSWPLKVRWTLGKVYHFGGLHVGGALAGTAVVPRAGRSRRPSMAPACRCSRSRWALVALLVVIVATAPAALPFPLPRPLREDPPVRRLDGARPVLGADRLLGAQKPFAARRCWPLVTFSVALPWLRLRKVAVRIERPSSHVALARFDHGVTPFAGSSTAISRSPLHASGTPSPTCPHPASPASG